jgi:holin-like protein
MLPSLTVILLFEVSGDVLQTLLHLPVPGPVVGMALLLVALIGKGRLPDGLDRAASGILCYLPMMFVPAGVGIMVHFELIRAEWLAICAALVVSSVLAIVITAATMRGIERAQQAVREAARNQATKPTVEGVR